MPALSLFGQKTCIAGDDLWLSSILFIALRLLQLAVLIPLSIFAARDNHDGYSGCPDEDYRHDLLDQSYAIFVAYVANSYFLVAVGLFVDVGICRATGKGTPTQPEKRTNVRRFCHVKLIPLSIIRIVTITLGLISAFIFKDYCDCIPDPESIELLQDECDTLYTFRTYFVILVSTHCVEAFSVAIICIYFACKCTPNPPPLADARTRWSCCCHCCMSILTFATCCCLGGREVGDYGDIAMVLSDFINGEGTLDVVTSDIVMALLMLLRVQDERRAECVDDVLEKAREYEEGEQQNGEEEDDDKSFESAKEMEEEGVEVGEEFKDARDEKASTDSDNDSIDSAMARLALSELHQTSRHKLTKSLVLQMDRTESTGKVYNFRPTARAILLPTKPLDKLAIAEGARFMRYARAMYSWKMDMIEKPVPTCATFGLQVAASLCSKRNENVVGDNRFGLNDASLESFSNIEPEQLVYASFAEGIGKIPFCVLIDHEWKSVVISIRGTLSLEDAVTDISLRPESLEAVGTRCGFDGRLCYAHSGILADSEWVYSELERLNLLEELLLKDDARCAGYRLRVVGHSLGAGCAAILSIMLRSKFPDVKGLCFSPPGCVLSRQFAESSKDFLTSYVLNMDIVPRLSQESMENLRDDVLEMIARIKVSKRTAVVASRGRGNETIDDLLYSKHSIAPSQFKEELTEFRKRYADRKEGRSMVNVQLVPPGNLVHLVNTGFRQSIFSRRDLYTAQWIEANDLSEIIISARLLDDHNPLNVLNELEYLANEEFGLSSPFTIDGQR